MTALRVEMVKSPGLTDEECRQRLSAAYRIILECARRAQRKGADEDVASGGCAPPVEEANTKAVRAELKRPGFEAKNDLRKSPTMNSKRPNLH